MIRSISTLFICLTLFISNLSGQTIPRYLVLFKDKASTPFSISKPTDFLSERAVLRRTRQNIAITERDFPVNPAYVSALKQTGARVFYSSRWFNGSLIEATADQLAAIKKLSFYKGLELDKPLANITTPTTGILRSEAVREKFETNEDLDYGSMRNQLTLLGADVLHRKGFHGENMIVAVLDAGFSRANEVGYMKAAFDEKRIIDTHDFIARDGNVYNDHFHGLNALSTIAAYQPGSMIGIAFKASFALYRTEAANSESPYEEVTWLLAAERADSLGTDVINTSLGYNTFDGEFNTPEYNYTYQNMDGKTTIISRAARYATRTGMIIVNAAGNSGDEAWHYITAPADVDSVLSVGATNYDRSYAAFSSVGPNAIGQMKPDVAAVGSGAIIGNNIETGTVSSGSGTSFSSPQIAGLVAILWQAYPFLKAQEVISVLKRSGHQATRPDNLLGYGVPSINVAEEIINKEFSPTGTEPDPINDIVLVPNPVVQDATVSFPTSMSGKKATFDIILPNGTSFSSKEATIQNNMTIGTAALPSGLYLLKITVKDRIRTLKFIRQ